jgi:hypothetical protein
MPQPAAASALPGPLAKLSGTTLQWIQVLAGLITAISVFFPWATVTFSIPAFEGIGGGESSTSGNGFDKSGGMATLILLLGLAVAALAFITVRGIQLGSVKLPWFTAPVLGFLLFLFSLIEWASTLSDVSDAKDALGFLGTVAGADASTGFGVWLLIIFALVAFAASVLVAWAPISAAGKQLFGKKTA